MTTTRNLSADLSQSKLSSLTDNPGKIDPHDNKPLGLVDTGEEMARVIDTLEDLPTNPPSLYIDLEGIDLSRNGSISILQIYVAPLEVTHLIDVHVMKAKAFNTPGANGRTFQDILESDTIPKVFFDVRNDSDAMHSHYGVRLRGIVDLQLLELATRTSGRRLVHGLAKCLERDAGLSASEEAAWQAGKERGKRLFAPERGGSYEVFNQRPLAPGIRDYCVEDVRLLPRLWRRYDGRLTPAWRARVADAAVERVRESQGPAYNGKGRHMALAPAGWALM